MFLKALRSPQVGSAHITRYSSSVIKCKLSRLIVNDTSHLFENKTLESIWAKFLPEALKNKSLKLAPEPLVVGKGLEKIPEAIAISRKGVSARKLVVSL